MVVTTADPNASPEQQQPQQQQQQPVAPADPPGEWSRSPPPLAPARRLVEAAARPSLQGAASASSSANASPIISALPNPSPTPPNVHPRTISLSSAQTCRQPMRRLSVPAHTGGISLMHSAHTSSIEGIAALKLNLLRNRSRGGPYPDSKSELTSPQTGGASNAASSRAPSPYGTHDDYHELTGGLDPYEHEAMGSPESDDGLEPFDEDQPAGLSFVERLIFYASRTIVRIGELACSSLMSLAVIFALFGEPIRLGYASRSFDPLFLLLTICVFALFILEASIVWCFAYFAHSQHSGSPQQLSPSANPAASLMQTPPGMPDDPIFPILPTLDSVSPPPPSYVFPTTLLTYSPWLALWWALCSSAAVSVNISLESLLDLVSIVSLLPQILYMSELISLSPWEREVLIIGKAGFFIRLLGMIRWIPIDLVRVESVFAHATDRQWWTTVAWPAVMHSSSHIAVQAIKTIPSPIQHIRQLGLGFGKKKNVLPPAQRNSPSSGHEKSVSPQLDESPRTVRSGSGQSTRQSPSDSSPSSIASSPPILPLESPHSAAAAYAAANLLRLHSYSSSSSNSSAGSNATPPQHPLPHNKHIGMHVHTVPLHSQQTATVGRSNNVSPASGEELLSSRANTPDSGRIKPITRPVALQQLPPPAMLTHVAPFSPRLPLTLGGAAAPPLPLPHHRSPMLLNRQLRGGTRTPSESPLMASIPPSSRLISLTGMSPAVQHRRVASSGPTTASSGAQSPALVMPSAASPRHVSSPRSLQVGQQSFGPPPVSSRAISLTSMSPVVTSRTLLARQAQQQQQFASSQGTLQTPLGSGPPTPMAAASPATTLYDSPLNRTRSLSSHAAPPMRMLASPALSSRALSGLAALLQPPHNRGSNSSPRDLPSPASLHSNLSPPMQLAQTPQALALPAPSLVRLPSRSAASSPRIRNRGSLMAYNPDNESSSMQDLHRENSPSLAHTEADDGSELLMLQHLAHQNADLDAASPIPPPESPRSASHLSHASHIGQLLSDFTAHRVVLGLLIILFAWHITNPLDIDSRPSFGLQRIQSQIDRFKQPDQPLPAFLQATLNKSDGSTQNKSAVAFPPLLGAMLDQYKATWSSSLVFLRVGTHQLVNDVSHQDLLRTQEVAKLRTQDAEGWIDIRSHSQLNARVDLATMIWLILMLPILLFVVYKDVHAVVTPIERMVSFVTSLARDPLSTQLGVMTGGSALTPTMGRDLSLEETLLTRDRATSIGSTGSNGSDTSTLASSFVELTFQRLGMLLQVGFGMAGSEIIAANISGDILDPMIPGSRVYAIFGFCEISDFNKATEILEESIMAFVNQIAHIVHEQCHHFGGRVNKNIGQAFLLVWKFDREDMRVLKQVCKAKHGKQSKEPFGISGGQTQACTEERCKEPSDIFSLTPHAAAAALLDFHRPTTIDPIQPLPDSEPALPMLPLRRMSSRDADPSAMPPLPPGRQRSASMRQSRPAILLAPPSSHATQSTFGDVMHRAEPIDAPLPPPPMLLEPAVLELPSAMLNPTHTTPLTAASLFTHNQQQEASSDSSNAAPSAPPSRTQRSRRLSAMRSMSAVAPRKEGDSGLAEALEAESFVPALVRSVSDSMIIEESPTAILDVKSTSPPHVIPSVRTAHLRMPTIGHGEMISVPKPMGFSMDNSTRSDFSTPVLLSPSSLGSSFFQPSLNSSAVPSHFTSGVPSPIGAVVKPAIVSPPYFATGSVSQQASSAMSRLFKLDSAVSPGGPTSTNMLVGFRRLSQPQLPATSELVEDSDSGEEEGIHSIRKMIAANAAKRGSRPAGAAPNVSAQSEPITQLTTPTHASVPEHETSSAAVPEVILPPAPVTLSVASTPIKKDPTHAVPLSSVMPRRSGLMEAHRLFANAGRPASLKRSDSRTSVASTQSTARHSPSTVPAQRTVIHRIANQALSAFLSTLIHVSTDPTMLRWRSDPALLAHGYSGPNMGFGLHVGWAIEGAIGSAHKIDASYLSPNVNMTARLCSATRQYRIPLLFSGWFYKLLDPAIQKRCRHVDQVIVKGSNQPVDLYTFDVCPGWKRAAAASMTGAALAADAVSHGVAPRPAAASAVPCGPNYAKMRSEWMAQMKSMNFKLPTRRRHSNPASSAADAVAATAAQAGSGGDVAAAAHADEDKTAGPVSGLRRRLSSIHLFPSAAVAAPVADPPALPSAAPLSSSIAVDAPLAPASSAAPLAAAASSTVLPSVPLPVLERSTTTPAQRKNSNPDLVADMVNAGLMSQLGSLLAQLQCDLPDNYVSKFNEGIKLYIAGDWGRAGQCLVQFQTMHREKVAALAPMDALSVGDAAAASASAASIDGPSNLILQFMGKHAFQAPKGWKGYRKLERK